MANSYTSLKLSYDTAKRFVDDFHNANNAPVKYVFIGNSNAYANSDTTIPDIADNLRDEKSIWDTMFAAKRITGNDVELVIPRVNWTANTVYKQFDDIVEIDDLITANTVLGRQPIYVFTSEGNVYKCLCNNVSANSTVEPTGDYNSSNGFIYTADDYVWKYMYNVRDSNKFLTDDWIPAPASTAALEYSMSNINLVDGALAKIVVTSSGTGYIDSNVNVSAYATGTTTITGLSDMANVANNMLVVGTGVISGTYVADFSIGTNSIVLSAKTFAAGGAANNQIQLKTRVVVVGDGDDDIVTSAILANTQIRKIVVSTVGTNYSRANVTVYGTGSGANARAVLPPKLGHGYNSARELGGKNVMIVKKIGEVDSSEGGLISEDTSFRQYGLLSFPNKYGETTAITLEDANTVISQTTDVDLTAGSLYTLNEVVYQGQSFSEATFTAVVHAQSTNTVRLTNVKGDIIIGGYLKGDTSLVQNRAVQSVSNPEFEPYTGDILFVQNALPVSRYEGQAENIKFVIKF